jgi:hypothetical protein
MRTSRPPGHRSPAMLRWASIAASTPASASSKATKNASPSVPSSYPQWRCHTERNNSL